MTAKGGGNGEFAASPVNTRRGSRKQIAISITAATVGLALLIAAVVLFVWPTVYALNRTVIADGVTEYAISADFEFGDDAAGDAGDAAEPSAEHLLTVVPAESWRLRAGAHDALLLISPDLQFEAQLRVVSVTSAREELLIAHERLVDGAADADPMAAGAPGVQREVLASGASIEYVSTERELTMVVSVNVSGRESAAGAERVSEIASKTAIVITAEVDDEAKLSEYRYAIALLLETMG